LIEKFSVSYYKTFHRLDAQENQRQAFGGLLGSARMLLRCSPISALQKPIGGYGQADGLIIDFLLLDKITSLKSMP
jgi:hypothetical protein